MPTALAHTDLPTGPTAELVERALKVPRYNALALILPLGGSTFRAQLVDRYGTVMYEVTVEHPGLHWSDLNGAVAAAIIHFGMRPAYGVGSIAGPIPERGLLEFTNLDWPAFDRDSLHNCFGLDIDWLNDAQQGYYGLRLLGEDQFVELHAGVYQRGDRRRYAIFGTGLNIGADESREDGHSPAPAKNTAEYNYCRWLERKLGYWPDVEEAVSGGCGFRYAAEYVMSRQPGVAERSDFKAAFDAAPEHKRGEMVDRFAMQGDPLAVKAAELVFGLLGTWLGSMAVTHQARRIDITCGILSKEPIRTWALAHTQFLANFCHQGRPQFSSWASECTLTVCTVNPECLGAVARVEELLGGS